MKDAGSIPAYSTIEERGIMEIRHKEVKDLTDVEYRACYRANYGWDGYMQTELVNARNGEQEGIAIMLWDGPDNTIRSMRGWALLTPTKTNGLTAVSRYGKKNIKYTAEFWVKTRYRRKGLGTLLMQEVKKYDKRPHVLPHDKASSELFSCFDVYVLQHERYWLKNKPKRDTMLV